jgi:glycosyltransferase involved in cell wall biosynthesis
MRTGAQLLEGSHVCSDAEACTMEVSVVMPCLNEADTLEVCIRKAQQALWEGGIAGEVIIADNGSTDDSVSIAEKLGARVVPVIMRGYGAALMGGIAAARGHFIIMGDADDSYDFLELEKFVTSLREGAELVQGCRLPSGGGRILPKAMPFLHRWCGNPMFTFLARNWFHTPVHDIYCGFRGFQKAFYEKLDLRCTGMEFAPEMIIKASLREAKMAEVPITLHPDGRKSHPPHLKTFHDGWRTLRLFLLLSPRSLFLWPAGILIAFGLLAHAFALLELPFFGVAFDTYTLLFGTLSILMGFHLLLFGFFALIFADHEGLMPLGSWIQALYRRAKLKDGIAFGLVSSLVGLCLLGWTMFQFSAWGFASLDYARTMRRVIPGMLLVYLGVQIIFSGFFISILSLRRK